MKNTRKFIVRNESFICEYCDTRVQPLLVGCRNHCHFCLCSKHIDINPGDRANSCGGKQSPYSYKTTAKKGIVMLFSCDTCKEKTCNKSADTDPLQPDSLDSILKLLP